MEFFNELLFSFVSILLALLIGKLASTTTAAAGDLSLDSSMGSDDPSQLGAKRRSSEEAELVGGVQSAGEGSQRSDEARADGSDRDSEKSRAEKGSELVKEEVYEFELGEEERGGKESSLLHGEDEWEGIESSGKEKLFRAAAEYLGGEIGGNALSKLSNDVRMQLYGLHKVATEGPCYEPQPMAFKVSARARWHAWQKLGNMNPDVAMEQYISLISESIPCWMGENSEVQAEHDKGKDIPYKGISKTRNPDLSSVSLGQTSSDNLSILEDQLCNEIKSGTTASKIFEKGLAKTFVLDLLSPTRVAFLVF